MTPIARKLRPLIKCHGGKAYLARRIIAHFPDHEMYVEPFAGGLSVLLNKPRAPLEIAGDLDDGLIGLYGVVQLHTAELLERLEALEYSPATFAAAAVGAPTDTVDAAVRFLVRNRMSRGGLGQSFAWSDRLRGGRPGDLNAWETMRAELPAIAQRLRGVEIRRAPALELIRQHDGPETVVYADPPYLPSTRTARTAYRHEMAAGDHAELLEALGQCRGTVVLSGYPSPLYDRRLAGWERVEFDLPNHSGQGETKQRRTEVLWIKPGLGSSQKPVARATFHHWHPLPTS
jgi:DNA adenine methylase